MNVLRGILLILTFTWFHACTYSQTPGYRGKRFSVGGELLTVPNVANKFRPNTIGKLESAFVLSRRFSTALHLVYSQSKYDVSFVSVAIRDDLTSELATAYPEDEIDAFIRSRFWGIELHYYPFNFISPVGTYFSLSYSSGTIGLIKPVELQYILRNPTSRTMRELEPAEFKANWIRLGMNIKRIIGSTNMYYSAGFEMGFVFGPDLVGRSKATYQELSWNEATSYLVTRSHKGLLEANLKIGVGFVF